VAWIMTDDWSIFRVESAYEAQARLAVTRLPRSNALTVRLVKVGMWPRLRRMLLADPAVRTVRTFGDHQSSFARGANGLTCYPGVTRLRILVGMAGFEPTAP
jgi:hypothetical protein